MKKIMMLLVLIVMLFLEENFGGHVPSPSRVALREKYMRISSALKVRPLSTFKAQDLPHLLRVMSTNYPDENDRELMESVQYLENLV